MAITPGPGYMVDPKNPNSVIPIGSSAQAQGLGVYNTPTPSSGVITKTSTAPAQPNTTQSTSSPGLLSSNSNSPVNLNQTTVPTTIQSSGMTGLGTSLGSSGVLPTVNPNAAFQNNVTSAGSSPTPTNTNLGSTTGNQTGGFNQNVSSLANTASAGSPTAATAGQGALSTAQNQSAYNAALANYNAAIQAVSDFKSREASQFSNLEASGEPLGLVTGREAALQAGYAGVLDSLQQKVTSASNALNAGVSEQNAQTGAYSAAGNIGNTAQQTAQSGLGTATQATQPVTLGLGQYQSSVNGEPLGTGIGGAVQNATLAGEVNNNIAQGNSFASQAAPLATTMAQIDSLVPQITSFLTTNGINSQTAPGINSSINTYLSQQNPAAIASLNLYNSELQKYTEQILLASGQTPTQAESQLQGFNVGNFTPTELNQYLSTLKAVGNTNLQPLQQSSSAAYGANQSGNVTPYQGTPATPPPTTSPVIKAPANQNGLLGSTNPGIQAIAGTAMQFAGGITNAIEGLFSKIF